MSDSKPFHWQRSARPSRVLFFMLVVGCLSIITARPQERKDAQKDQDEVISLKARLVNIDVMVKDKRGRFVPDLKAEDFTVYENGVQQKIDFFDPPLSGGNQATPSPAAPPKATTAAGQPKAIPPSGNPSNIISLVIDGQTTELANLKQVREGTIKYIREHIANTDTVAVFGIANDLQLLQYFTSDKERLIAAVEKAYTLTASNRNLERSNTADQIARLREELNGAPSPDLPQSRSEE